MVRRPLSPLFPIAAALLLISVAGPIVAVLTAISPAEVVAAFATQTAHAALRTSFEASLAATALATISGVPAGYWLAHVATRLRFTALFVLALPLAFPPVASGIMLLYVLGTHATVGGWLYAHGILMTESLLGVIAAEFFVSGSFVAITATAAFAALDPRYEETARTLGAGEWRIFTRIALPAASSTVAAGVALAWLRAIGEYGATSIVAYHPTSLPIDLYVTLASTGVRAALTLCYGFVVFAAFVLGGTWFLRRRITM